MYSIVVVKTAVVVFVYHLLIRLEVLLAIASLAECSALCRRWKEGVRTCHQHTSQSRNHRCAACMLFWDLGWSLIFARKGRSSLGTPCQEEEVEKGSPPGCAEEKLVLLQHDFLHPCQVAPSGCLASWALYSYGVSNRRFCCSMTASYTTCLYTVPCQHRSPSTLQDWVGRTQACI